MDILIHNASTSDFNLKLQNIITSAVSREEVCFTSDPEALTMALLKYRIGKPILVVQICSMDGITSLKILQKLFDDLFLIIVTDSADADLLQECRKLYPRLLVDNEKDFELIDVVIRKRQNMPI
ncbi:hypothetical protein [Desulfopila sp. IMCC35008]|uniref:hypothetical protein n=1 Tax=Desulfopila sp. IMCC35008 TaxID=2653858 RepID=UPI0013D35738|nr:hypothetical protein [Desulfopila sp. IMCC35008]